MPPDDLPRVPSTPARQRPRPPVGTGGLSIRVYCEAGVTRNGAWLLKRVVLGVTTSIFPVVAPAGTVVVISVAETTVKTADVPYLMDIAPSRYDLLARSLNPGYSTTSKLALWVLALPAGVARRTGGIVADDATWSPDGQEIAYVTGNLLYRCGKSAAKKKS